MLKTVINKFMPKSIFRNPSIEDRRAKSLNYIEDFRTLLLSMKKNEAEEKLAKLKPLLPKEDYHILLNVHHDFPIESNYMLTESRISRIKEKINN